MNTTKDLMNSADRALELLEQKSPHQLAVELAELQQKHDIALAALNKMQDQRDQLVSQLKDATAQCGVMADLLRDAFAYIDDDQDHCIQTGKPLPDNCSSLLSRIDASLAGKLPVPVAPNLDYVQGASDFKQELLKSTKAFVHPHIEGVFAVFNNLHERATPTARRR